MLFPIVLMEINPPLYVEEGRVIYRQRVSPGGWDVGPQKGVGPQKI